MMQERSHSTGCIENDATQQHIIHIVSPISGIESGDSCSLQLNSLSIISILFAPFTACLSRKNRLSDKSTHTCASSQSSDEEYYFLEEDDCEVEEKLENQTDVSTDHNESSSDDSSSACGRDIVSNRPAHRGGVDEEDSEKEYVERCLNDDIGHVTSKIIDQTSNCSASNPSIPDNHTEDVGNTIDNDNYMEISAHHCNLPTPTTSMNLPTLPTNTRSKTCAHHTDLSGSWTLVIADNFLLEYDNYLTALGINYFVRKVALQVIYQTTEVIEQSSEGGTELRIIGSNPKGVWDRTLIASNGVKVENNDGDKFTHERFQTTTAEGEDIMSEAWWEEGGTVHRSILLDAASKYGGGDFESKRFLDAEDNYICVSTFHPQTEGMKPVSITWKYSRVIMEEG